jgi:Lrp/AsnC family transcriptional regulator, leucine-responsive regulatory protein
MEDTAKPVDLDEYDRKILNVLREDGRITVTDLAQRIGLSKTPCQQRLKRLIDNRVIIGFTALIDPTKLARVMSPSPK